MRQWIGYVLWKRREDAGLSHAKVAWHAEEPIGRETLWRCEEGVYQWPKKLDVIVGAYARALNATEFELWEQAVQLWKQDPDGRTIESAKRARLRQRRKRRSP